MPTPKPTLLIVDDHPGNLTVPSEILQSGFWLRAATNGQRALELAELEPRPRWPWST